ncbi:MAG: transglutaminase-like domain-containing protein [Eubacteriales bacterium]|nr:transglutaminase-like domain-containing protein [Eubacteriales bacterium]
MDNIRSVSSESGRKQNIIKLIETAVSTALISCGFSLLSFFDLKSVNAVSALFIAAALISTALAADEIFRQNKKLRLRTVLSGICILILIGSYSRVIGSFVMLVNELIECWNIRYIDCVLQFDSYNVGLIDKLLMWSVIMLLHLLLTEYAVNTKNILLISFEVTAAVLMSAVFGLDRHGGVILVNIIGWIFAMSVCAPGHQLHPANVLSAAFFAAVLFAAAVVLQVFSGEDRVPWIRESIVSAIENIRYGSDTLPKGEIGRAGSIHSGNEDRLTVSTASGDKYYLRGYVGAEYTGTSWDELSKLRFTGDDAGILIWLDSEGLHPAVQLAEFKQHTDDTSIFSETAHISVKNVGADRRYVYVPAGTHDLNARFTYDMDRNLRARGFFGCRDYELDAEGLKVNPEQLSISGGEENAFKRPEQIYRGFVYKNYLDISDDMRAIIDEVFFRDETDGGTGVGGADAGNVGNGAGALSGWDPENVSLYTLTSRIRTILDMKEVYTEELSFTPGADDAVEDFLINTHAGNDVLFASAAVMAYRAMGFPARYAEGYIVPAENVSLTGGASGAGAVRELTLTSKNAHAWAEVYVDYAGWIPIELTPGYYDIANEPGEVIDVPLGAESDEPGQRVPVPMIREEEAQPQEPEAEKPDILRMAAAMLLMLLYLLLALLGILELQRFIRIRLEMAGFEEKADSRFRENIYDRFRVLAGAVLPAAAAADLGAAAKDDFLSAYEGISVYEYNKAVSIIQKSIFGGAVLSASERRILKSFIAHLEKQLSERGSLFKRTVSRYRYAV